MITTAVFIPIDEETYNWKVQRLRRNSSIAKRFIDDRLKHLKKYPQSGTSLKDFLADLDAEDA